MPTDAVLLIIAPLLWVQLIGTRFNRDDVEREHSNEGQLSFVFKTNILDENIGDAPRMLKLVLKKCMMW